MIPLTSRYYGIETAKFEDKDGRTIVYLRRRFVPPPEYYHLLLEHTVSDGERLDQITAKYLGDPEQFWRICDANAALDPHELLMPVGRKVHITLPAGVQGTSNV